MDCSAGALAGVLVLALSGWLAPPLALLTLLVAANLAWVPVCVALAVAYRAVATPFGFAHLLGEALFVGGLALLEWRHRALLLTAA
jgi:hypothetical protein